MALGLTMKETRTVIVFESFPHTINSTLSDGHFMTPSNLDKCNIKQKKPLTIYTHTKKVLQDADVNHLNQNRQKMQNLILANQLPTSPYCRPFQINI